MKFHAEIRMNKSADFSLTTAQQSTVWCIAAPVNQYTEQYSTEYTVQFMWQYNTAVLTIEEDTGAQLY